MIPEGNPNFDAKPHVTVGTHFAVARPPPPGGRLVAAGRCLSTWAATPSYPGPLRLNQGRSLWAAAALSYDPGGSLLARVALS